MGNTIGHRGKPGKEKEEKRKQKIE